MATPLIKKLARRIGQTVHDYGMIGPDDRILVAVSGGKDSWTMLHLLDHLRRVSPVRFELFPVTIDPGYPEFDAAAVEDGYRCICPDLPWEVVRTRIATTISEKNSPGKYPCAFCARLRRGALYRVAVSKGCNRVALGHHADDAIETVLLSALFEGNLVSLPPVLKPARYPLTVIRPLIRVWEDETIRFSTQMDFPAISCGHAENSGGKRAYIKKLLDSVSAEHPRIRRNLLASLHSIRPGHFLDKKWL